MGGVTRTGQAIYRCRTYQQTGSTACYSNTIEEAPLVACVVRKIQERCLSKPARDRLRRALEAEQDRTRPRPRDLVCLRREIEDLDRKIDQGAERVLEAPPEIVPPLYRKLEGWRAERERLNTELGSLTSRQARPDRRDDSEIDQAIEVLQNLSEALRQADPAETRELLRSLVSRVEVHFRHEATSGGRRRNEFSHGTIFVRPDAGTARSTDPKSTLLNTKGPLNGTFEAAAVVVSSLPGY